jgi:outer membrane protein OmpA-like peptidoglycan-associated protein
MNLFGNLKDTLPPALRAKLAQFVGESPEKTGKALDGLFPTVAGGLLKRASTETGLDQLFRTLQRTDFDKPLLDTLPTLLESPERTTQLISSGNGLVSQLLPDKKSSIATMISSYAKVRNSSATSLLGLTMPLVLATLRRETVERNLDVQGLGSLLADQREAWLGTIPEGLADKLFEVLGIDNWHGMDAALRNSGVAVQRRASAAIASKATPVKMATPPLVVEEPEEEASGVKLSRWLIPTLALVALGGGAYWYLNRPQTTESDAETEPVAEQVTPVSDTLARADSASRVPMLTDTSKKASPPATPPPAPTNQDNFIGLFNDYLKDPAAKPGRTFTLHGVKFSPAASMYTAESGAAIAQLAQVMKANPKVQIKLIGYAAEGDTLDNKRLSTKRANNIKSTLIESGINFIRIDAAGLGNTAGTSRIDVQVIHR